MLNTCTSSKVIVLKILFQFYSPNLTALILPAYQIFEDAGALYRIILGTNLSNPLFTVAQ